MTTVPMNITDVEWDTAASTVTITLTRADPIGPPPAGLRPDLWFEGARETVTFSAPVKKAVDTPQYGYYQQDINGQTQVTRYTWDGTAWGSPTVIS